MAEMPMLGPIPMSNPILVRAEGELMVFDSAQAAQRYAEWQDVEAGVYPEVYDSAGRRLTFEVDRRVRWWQVPRVVLRPLENEPSHI